MPYRSKDYIVLSRFAAENASEYFFGAPQRSKYTFHALQCTSKFLCFPHGCSWVAVGNRSVAHDGKIELMSGHFYRKKQTKISKKKNSTSVNRRVLISSVQFKMKFMRSGRPICAPPRLSGVPPMLSLKQFQCWCD